MLMHYVTPVPFITSARNCSSSPGLVMLVFGGGTMVEDGLFLGLTGIYLENPASWAKGLQCNVPKLGGWVVLNYSFIGLQWGYALACSRRWSSTSNLVLVVGKWVFCLLVMFIGGWPSTGYGCGLSFKFNTRHLLQSWFFFVQSLWVTWICLVWVGTMTSLIAWQFSGLLWRAVSKLHLLHAAQPGSLWQLAWWSVQIR